MTTTEPRPLAVRVRAVVALGLGVAAGAAAITVLSLLMRSVTAIGGSCADGGPYVSAQPCPDGTGTAVLLVLALALVCVIGTLYGSSVLGAPGVLWLGWPALFLTLGWNFLEDGFDPPDGSGGVIGGFVFCGLLFVAMGAAPLLLALSLLTDRRRARRRQAGPPPVVVHHPHLGEPEEPRQRRQPTSAPAADDLPGGDAPYADDPRASAMSIAGRLERLAALHASGELTDEEYRLAKAATLREEVTG
ncbi:SHOCT domain-containing protein [Blastococcus sp. SYSU D00813]